MALTNDFSWSKSRDEMFRACLRRYYFQYYGSWGGWNPDCNPRTRQLYILKSLQSRAMWAGDRVHRTVRTVLATLRDGGEVPTADAAADQLLAEMRKDFRDSLARRYRQYPRKACGLFEHEYELEIVDEQWKEIADHAVHCLQTFFTAEIFASICKLPADAWLEMEELASFVLAGIKVYVQLDFAQRTSNGVKIFDWKTGRSTEPNAEVQLACYALYAIEKWQVTPEQLQTIEFNLADGVVTQHAPDQSTLDVMKDYIRDSADEMSFLLEDPTTNRPQPEDSFEFTEDEAHCRRCNFLKICPRWV
ncbi:MAG: PD-(D/E)XK nuclease family protein [Kiritimatiellaeota bacterium]|nr:PD-(D/E)XK nuclease family protein [Kiritimatiellota bacterium]